MVKSVDNATKRTFFGKRNVANKAQSGKGKTHGTALHRTTTAVALSTQTTPKGEHYVRNTEHNSLPRGREET